MRYERAFLIRRLPHSGARGNVHDSSGHDVAHDDARDGDTRVHSLGPGFLHVHSPRVLRGVADIEKAQQQSHGRRARSFPRRARLHPRRTRPMLRRVLPHACCLAIHGHARGQGERMARPALRQRRPRRIRRRRSRRRSRRSRRRVQLRRRHVRQAPAPRIHRGRTGTHRRAAGARGRRRRTRRQTREGKGEPFPRRQSNSLRRRRRSPIQRQSRLTAKHRRPDHRMRPRG